jgi:hypothetical protein
MTGLIFAGAIVLLVEFSERVAGHGSAGRDCAGAADCDCHDFIP